jgi:zinc transporter 1/2/3
VLGITLVVAGDSVFSTLFAVIVFHQMFEGVALGTVIAALKCTSWVQKSLMCSAFGIITPIGMSIGVGVLEHFNGNDKSTIIALGTLNAVSAGILVWVGVVEMWAEDWMHGPLAHSGLVKTGCALFSLMLGMALMSLLGKWA